MEREMSFAQYCQLEVGKEYMITMYSHNGHTWYFSEEEAEYSLYH